MEFHELPKEKQDYLLSKLLEVGSFFEGMDLLDVFYVLACTNDCMSEMVKKMGADHDAAPKKE